jgi:hypothetical protein
MITTRKKQGKEPLVDYSSSHMVTLDQYLVVLKQKVMDKKVVKIRELKAKEKEDRRSRKVECALTQA